MLRGRGRKVHQTNGSAPDDIDGANTDTKIHRYGVNYQTTIHFDDTTTYFPDSGSRSRASVLFIQHNKGGHLFVYPARDAENPHGGDRGLRAILERCSLTGRT